VTELAPDTAEMPVRNPPKAGGKVKLMSLSDLDGRTLAAKRARSLVSAFEVDLGGGDRLSAGAKQLVARAACLSTLCESHEATWLAGQPVEIQDYLAATNNLRRILRDLKIERTRHARNVTHDIETSEYGAYLAALREGDASESAP
jgi:hypothetical protein